MLSNDASRLAVPAAPARYHPLSVLLHWLLGLLLVGLWVLGTYMSDLPFSPQRLQLYSWHKWAGITVLTLSLGRLLWRLAHRPPALPEGVSSRMPAWQRVAHHAVHHLLYLAFFAVPLLGWAYSSAAGFPVVLFGWWPLPDWVPVSEPLAEGLKLAHERSAQLLALLVIVHVAAALKHHWRDRDGLLSRMWFARGRDRAGRPQPTPP